MENIIEIKKLCVSYGSQKVLENISYGFKKNKITAVLGSSGCGKTTLLQALNNLLSEEANVKISGDIRLNGDSIYTMLPEALRKEVGLVFQTPVVFPTSIYKNMSYALSYHALNSRRDIDKAVEEKLKLAGLYEEVKDKLKKKCGEAFRRTKAKTLHSKGTYYRAESTFA